MNGPFGDARLEELKLLSAIDRADAMIARYPLGPKRDLLAHLVAERLVNDLASAAEDRFPLNSPAGGLPGESPLERTLHARWLETLARVLQGEEVSVRLTHRGRVRLSELKQSLRSGKARDSFDILWDGRHLDRDLHIAVLEASGASALSVGYLDMNGLKAINDAGGHDAGDTAIRTFLQTVSSVLGDQGDAYRAGGDEVVVLLPSHDTEKAKNLIRKVCLSLMGERLTTSGHPLPRLSVSVGIATATNPERI
jgi:diguanylate cyclase (GGDEF)-like protein